MTKQCDESGGLIFATLGLLLVTSGSTIASSGLAEYDQPWEICALCHSLDGNSRMAKFPKLAGQRKGYIEKQLKNFLEARRQNDGGQMSSIVTEIDPADFARIATWFESQEPPAPQESDQDEVSNGEALFFDNGCVECHNNSMQDKSLPAMPLLTAQHAAYLLKQLGDFQSDQREHANDELVDQIINEFSQSELASISAYLSSTPRQ